MVLTRPMIAGLVATVAVAGCVPGVDLSQLHPDQGDEGDDGEGDAVADTDAADDVDADGDALSESATDADAYAEEGIADDVDADGDARGDVDSDSDADTESDGVDVETDIAEHEDAEPDADVERDAADADVDVDDSVDGDDADGDGEICPPLETSIVCYTCAEDPSYRPSSSPYCGSLSLTGCTVHLSRRVPDGACLSTGDSWEWTYCCS